jgi:hypothetical protein
MKIKKAVRTILLLALAAAALWLLYLGGSYLVQMAMRMHGMGG